MENILVVYYSRKGENHTPDGIQVLEKGNTAYAAEHIQQAPQAQQNLENQPKELEINGPGLA